MAKSTIRRGILPVVVGVVVAVVLIGLSVALVVGDALGEAAEASEPAPERDERDVAMVWFARALLVLALAWIVIGALSVHTRLVRRPGAAGARASWVAATRPWRARESMLGMDALDLWLLFLVPVALLVATRAVQTAFLSWSYLAVVLGAWVVFALVLRLFVGRRSPWPVIAAVGGAVVLRCVVALAAFSFHGPDGYRHAVSADAVLRAVYLTLAFALFFWVFAVAVWALVPQLGARRATGAVMASAGAGLAIPAFAVAIAGLDRVLATWSDELGLMVPALPDATAWIAAVIGAAVAIAGALLAQWGRARAR